MEEIVVNNVEEVKPVEISVSAEEQELVFKGTRPEGMSIEVFKKVRKDLDVAKKLYLGGKYSFKSKRLFTKEEVKSAKEKENVDLMKIKGKTLTNTMTKRLGRDKSLKMAY